MTDDRPLHERLSRREYEVFVRIANGISGTAICAELGIARTTVGTIFRRIKDKTGLASKQHIAVYAFKHGIGLK